MRGTRHCGWACIHFLQLAWPFGTTVKLLARFSQGNKLLASQKRGLGELFPVCLSVVGLFLL